MKHLLPSSRFTYDRSRVLSPGHRQAIRRLFMGLLLTATLVTAIATNVEFRTHGLAANASEMTVAALWRQASFPVENFQAYTSPFGYRSDPYGGGQRFHYGLDLAAPMGSYIRNWWSGRVIEVSDDSSCGSSVVVQSGSWIHIYCHMQGHVTVENGSKYLVDSSGGVRIREGQTVETGHRIGRIGMTGRTTGPHLHWGLKYDDNWIDPALVLQAMYSSQQQASSQTN